jgi:hypothetical protein
MNDIQALDIKVQVREVGDTDWLDLVCELDSQFELSNDVSEVESKCGSHVGVKRVKGNNSGNAVFNVAPENTEISYSQVRAWQIARTPLQMRVINEAFTADDGTNYAEAAVMHYFYTGKFVNSVLQGPVGEVGKFSWTFKPTGTPVDSGASSG